jgi:hypothetical protein
VAYRITVDVMIEIDAAMLRAAQAEYAVREREYAALAAKYAADRAPDNPKLNHAMWDRAAGGDGGWAKL